MVQLLGACIQDLAPCPTVEALIKDPPRNGHCVKSLYRGHCLGNYHFLWFLFIENLREEDNLSIRDKTAKFGSTVHAIMHRSLSCKVFN